MRLPDSCQARFCKCGHGHVIKAHHRDILRHAYPVLRGDIDHAKGGLVVGRENRAGALLSRERENLMGTGAPANRVKIPLPDQFGVWFEAHLAECSTVTLVALTRAEIVCWP